MKTKVLSGHHEFSTHDPQLTSMMVEVRSRCNRDCSNDFQIGVLIL